MVSAPLLVVARLAKEMDQLGIPYVVGGSLASSLYGVPRSTRDVDIVADVRHVHAGALAQALQGEFYADVEMILDAVERKASFNVIHLATMFKADVFIPKGDAWSREEMARARTEEMDLPGGKTRIRFASPEDTLLHKLVWYQLGNRVSDRQWGDVLGVLRIQGRALDQRYLERWAPCLGVLDLLRQAMAAR